MIHLLARDMGPALFRVPFISPGEQRCSDGTFLVSESFVKYVLGQAQVHMLSLLDV